LDLRHKPEPSSSVEAQSTQGINSLPYPGLQHGYNLETAARATLLVEKGYGALEP
jgi:hypothetical protein